MTSKDAAPFWARLDAVVARGEGRRAAQTALKRT